MRQCNWPLLSDNTADHIAWAHRASVTVASAASAARRSVPAGEAAHRTTRVTDMAPDSIQGLWSEERRIFFSGWEASSVGRVVPHGSLISRGLHKQHRHRPLLGLAPERRSSSGSDNKEGDPFAAHQRLFPK